MIEIFDAQNYILIFVTNVARTRLVRSKLKIRHMAAAASNVKNGKEILIPCDTIAIKYDIPLRFICHEKEHELSR